MLIFKRTNNGVYLSNYQIWTGISHVSKYVITTESKGYNINQNSIGNINLIGHASTLVQAKRFAENYEEQHGSKAKDEIEDGFAAGGGWSGGVCITADGNGFSWHTDENGKRVDDK